MIRNKTLILLAKKRQTRGSNFKRQPDLMIYQPWWFQQYEHQKQSLKQIHQRNKRIKLLSIQYQSNPSVYSLKIIQKQINDNSKLIVTVDEWTNHFKYSSAGTALLQCEKSINLFLQQQIAHEIITIMQAKQTINEVNSYIDFSHSRSRVVSQNNSFSHSQIPQNLNQQNSRQQILGEVTNKIQNLNNILKRMNALVLSQGDIVNRIDENLENGQQNMKKANKSLDKRVRKQQGSGQFSFQGKINKAITSLYFFNIGLIIFFLIKHLIF